MYLNVLLYLIKQSIEPVKKFCVYVGNGTKADFSVGSFLMVK